MERTKLQEPNDKQYQRTNDQCLKVYDLEDRTLIYANRVNDFVSRLPRNQSNLENGKQLIRSAGSVGANYIEANEGLGKKDFAMKIKISRKEAKESRFWLNLCRPLKDQEAERSILIAESTELIKIFSAILLKCSRFKY